MKKIIFTSLIATSLLLVSCSNEDSLKSDNAKNEMSSTESQTSENKKPEIGSIDENGNLNINYTSDFSDNWHNLDTKIDKVLVVKAPNPETNIDGSTQEGAIGVNFSITNNSENNIMVYPNQASLVLEGQQIKADMINSDTNLGGEILPEVNKTGVVVFSIPKLAEPENIKSIRLSWQATDTKVEDINDYSKTYDIEIPLTLAE